MRVFLTGATGFVGNEVLRQLLEQKHRVRCLVRRGSENKLPRNEGLEIHPGEVNDFDAVEEGLDGCDAIIHLVGIIREIPYRGVSFQKLHVEATRVSVAAARSREISRFVHMSALGADPASPIAYFSTKARAEEVVRTSGLEWTLFRPSLVFGPGGEFVHQMCDLVRTLPIVPVVGSGRYRMTPVAVRDVAQGFVAALEVPASIGNAYSCCGPKTYSFNELLDLFGLALGRRRVFKLPSPLALVRPAVSVFQHLPFFPLTRDQLEMLVTGSVCDPTPWAQTFGLHLTHLEDQLEAILERYRQPLEL